MLFTSFEFAIFLPLVFALYWVIGGQRKKLQNILIVAASYLFYGWWDWRFLSLIALSTIVDFVIGNLLHSSNSQSKRRVLLAISILVNIGILGYFKYANFFIENFADIFTILGQNFETSSLNIILPVGISFYTFQTLSYTIDIYRKKLSPSKNIIDFAAFVCFFPQLVAGPIERATNLLPQFQIKRSFNYKKTVDGLKQILWGLFKKIVIADNCAYFANEIFNNYGTHNGSALLLGALFFSFQIYGDFSGYSDIAIGTAQLFGFNLRQNFAFPYFSRDIAEFWRRWHISLSTWFRDYLYIPLGGSRGSNLVKIRNIFIIFIVSGFWHGANWTFIFWGALNAIYFLPLLLLKKNRKNMDDIPSSSAIPKPKVILGILSTFSLTTLAWIFFRAENLNQAFNYINSMLNVSIFSTPSVQIDSHLIILFGLLAFFLIIEWLGRTKQYAIESFGFKKPKIFRHSFYYALIICIFLFAGKEQAFIYFQF